MDFRNMAIRGVWRNFLPARILALGFVALMLSCEGNGHTPAEPRTWYYEPEFAEDSGLVAGPDHVVILDIMPGEGLTDHSIPYQYDEGGPHLFAIESEDPFIARVEIFDRSGVLVAATEQGDGGVYLDLTAGGYTIKAYHDGTDVPPEGTVAFIRRQIAGQSAAGPGRPNAGEGIFAIGPEYPAYVALQIVGGDYDGQYLAAVTVTVKDSGGNPYIYVNLLKPVPIDTTGSEFQNRGHLSSFETKDENPCYGDIPPFADYYCFHSWPYKKYLLGDVFCCAWSPVNCPDSQDNKPGDSTIMTFMPQFTNEYDYSTVGIQDIGDGTFVPWIVVGFQPCSPMYAAENGYMYFTEYSSSASPDRFKIVDTFRFYKDGSQISKKDRQELKTGEVALYEGENYTGVAVVLGASFSDTTLIPLAQVKSVAFGLYTDTTIQFFSEPGFSGNLIKTVGVDMPNNLDITGDDIGSIKIFDSRKVLISSKKCPYCNLAGADLSNLNLDAADLSYANLMRASMHYSSLIKANISHALLHGANLTNANLSGASLYNAFLNGNTALNLGAATLTGAYLKNANLAGANLGGADFINASFYSGTYIQTGCAQDDQNPPFTKNCASAHGANMNATNFGNAYLAGADFSSATATGANFSGAILSGANFKNARLDWDSPTSAKTVFSGAFIGGADFTNATASGANFENAYVNFSEIGDCMLFTVSAEHTKFPGFYYQYGDCPCVMFAYSAPTAVVDTDSGNICPDGNTGPCDDTSWTSPSIPRDRSTQPNSSCNDTPPLCDIYHIDPKW